MGSMYELQAARIESVLTAYRAPARVWQATVTPRFVRFAVTTALGTRLDRVTGLDEELAMALGVSSVRIARSGGAIHVDVPREDARRTVALARVDARLEGQRMGHACAVLGIDEEGTPLLLWLPSPDVAHVLIAGTTGSGKTALLRTMVASLAQRNPPGLLQFVLLDPKGFGLAPFADLPHTRVLAEEPADVLAALSHLVGEMERRGRDARPRLVVAIDELAEVVMTAPEAVYALTRLTQRGREVGIHVVAATQRPAAALVGSMAKANFPVRLVGSVTSADDARVATGMPGTGAERLLGQGDFLLVAKGQVIRFQAAYTDAAALAELGGALARCRREIATGAPVHRPPESASPPLLGPGAPVKDEGDHAGSPLPVPAVGQLARRPGGPTPAEALELRRRYALLGSLNRVVESAYGSKSPLTLDWVRRAVVD